MSEDRRTTRWLEAIGALGVIASLMFVGFEVRQNTAVAKAEAYRDFVSEINAVNLGALDPVVNRAFVRLKLEGADPADLTTEEVGKLGAIALANLRIYEGLFNQVETGILEPTSLGLMSRVDWRATHLQMYLAQFRGLFSPEFVEYFEATHNP